MKIIKAQLKHQKEISCIFSILDNEHYYLSDLKKINKNIEKNQCFIAIEDKKVIGAMVLLKDEGTCHLDLLVSKKKGTGRKLIDIAIKYCKKNKLKKLWCWSLAKYEAVGFYRKMNFEEVYLLKNQWYGEDCYFFGKQIE